MMKYLPLASVKCCNLSPEGHPNRKIASLLQISVKTVDNNHANLMGKLDLNSTADMIQYAIRVGIISQDD